MKYILLTQGRIAIVCDCHYDLVKSYKWHTHKARSAYYAICNIKVQGRPVRLRMHNIINGTPKGFQTDHRDGNTLNNQCGNLRIATQAQNQQNRSMYKNNRSGFKGVHWSTSAGKWIAKIGYDSKCHILGYFDDKERAAAAYQDAALKHHGKFARF